MAGKLDRISPSKETPRAQIRPRNEKPAPKSTQYSAVLPVVDSPKPLPSVADQAVAQSMQEEFEKKMGKSGGKSRRRKSKKSKKTKRR
jgi:hypothetical protein